MPKKFDVDHFRHILRTAWLGSEFHYIKKIGSTNSYLKDIPSSELVHGTVLLADHQEKGRGQYEKKWQAEPYKNLTFTIAFRPQSSERLNLLALAVAYAVARQVEAYVSEPVQVKWPNDIFVRGKKLGGLLTECTFNGQRPDRVLIGLGLNVGQDHFSNGVGNSAISLNRLVEQTVSREELLADILIEIEQVYQRWHKQDERLQQDISRKLIGYGEWVQISINQEVQERAFKLIGISTNGELLMLNEQLDVNKFTYEQVRIIAGHKGVPESETDPSA